MIQRRTACAHVRARGQTGLASLFSVRKTLFDFSANAARCLKYWTYSFAQQVTVFIGLVSLAVHVSARRTTASATLSHARAMAASDFRTLARGGPFMISVRRDGYIQ